MHKGLTPSLAMDGAGGTYFIPNSMGKYVACFKPRDEEPFTINNPRGQAWSGVTSSDQEELTMRKGIRPGDAYIREVAAYILDTRSFTGVPETTLVECENAKFCYNDKRPVPKLGSFQAFVPNVGVVEDFGLSKFTPKQVHKLAMFDIRVLNGDRNGANILVRENCRSNGDRLDLVPIDHGFCLSEVLNIGWCDWCWLDWPQLKEPMDQEILDYIDRVVDPIADAALLREKLSLPEQCLTFMRLAGMLLKCGAREGLTLHDIASLIVRLDLECEEESILEHDYHVAKQLAWSKYRMMGILPVQLPSKNQLESKARATTLRLINPSTEEKSPVISCDENLLGHEMPRHSALSDLEFGVEIAKVDFHGVPLQPRAGSPPLPSPSYCPDSPPSPLGFWRNSNNGGESKRPDPLQPLQDDDRHSESKKEPPRSHADDHLAQSILQSSPLPQSKILEPLGCRSACDSHPSLSGARPLLLRVTSCPTLADMKIQDSDLANSKSKGGFGRHRTSSSCMDASIEDDPDYRKHFWQFAEVLIENRVRQQIRRKQTAAPKE